MIRRIYHAILTVIAAVSAIMVYGTIGSIDRELVGLQDGIRQLIAWLVVFAVSFTLTKIRRAKRGGNHYHY